MGKLLHHLSNSFSSATNVSLVSGPIVPGGHANDYNAKDMNGAIMFLSSIPIPPMFFLILASVSTCLLNALCNYVLARASEVPILKTEVTTLMASASTSAATVSATTASAIAASTASQQQEMACMSSSFAGYGTMQATSPLRATHQYQHRAIASQIVRRYAAQDEQQYRETDALISGDALHFPVSPMPTHDISTSQQEYGVHSPAYSFASPVAATGSSQQQMLLLPEVYITPTTSSAQANAFPSGAMPSNVEAAVAAADRQAKLKEVRLEAQYIVFDTNRFYLLASVIKALVMLMILHYYLELPGGWKRFTIATGVALMSGLLSPIVELVSAALLPNDAEVLSSRIEAVKASLDSEENQKEARDSILVVELVLSYCTYDFKDLTTVFIQGSVFILIGVVFLPPVMGYCIAPCAAYAWLFAIPIVVLFVFRRSYYGEERLVSDSKKQEPRSIRAQGWIELLKCVTLKSVTTFLILWTVQSSFVLAMSRESKLSYWDALGELLMVEIAASPLQYLHTALGSGTFWILTVVSQLVC